MSQPTKKIKISEEKQQKLKSQFENFQKQKPKSQNSNQQQIKQSQEKTLKRKFSPEKTNQQNSKKENLQKTNINQKEISQQKKLKISNKDDSDFEIEDKNISESLDNLDNDISSLFDEDQEDSSILQKNKKKSNKKNTNSSTILSQKKQTKISQKQKQQNEEEGDNTEIPIKKVAKKSKKDLQKLSVDNVDELINLIKSNTKQDFKTDYVLPNKVRNSIGMKGCQPNTYVEMTRPGEYFGLGLIILEKSRGIIHSERIIKCLQKTYIDNNLQAVVEELQISDIIGTKGLQIIHFIISQWLNFQGFPLPPEIQQQVDQFQDLEKIIQENQDLVNWVQLGRHSPLIEKVKIAQLGEGKNGSYNVVPETWLDREFEGTQELHDEMGNLDWRRGKPKITFGAIYSSMTKIEPQNWCNKQQILKNTIVLNQKPQKFNINLAFLENNQDTNKTSIINVKSLKELEKTTLKHPEQTSYIVCPSRKQEASLIIALNKNDYFNEEPIYKKSNMPVGICISRLQKAIRQSNSPNALIQAMEQVQFQRPYTLPENNFRTVSASRQLLWRAFIIILEDSRIYMQKPKTFGLQEIIILSIICQLNSDIQINSNIFNKLVLILLKAQQQNKPNDIFNWRSQQGQLNNKKLNLCIEQIDQKDEQIMQSYKQLKNSFKIALNYQPMMSGDEKMVSQSLQILNKQLVKSSTQLEQNLKSINVTYQNPFKTQISQYLEKSEEKTERKVLISAIDHHCKPNIIIKLQGSLPFTPKKQYDTKQISAFIWNYSSSYNIRTQNRNNVISTDEQKYILQNLRDIQQYIYYHYDKNMNINDNILQLNDENNDKDENQKIQEENQIDTLIKNQELFQKLFKQLQKKFNFDQEIEEKQYILKNAEVQYQNQQEKQQELQQQDYKIAFFQIFGFKQKFSVGNKKYLDAIISGESQGQCIKIKKQSQNQMIYLTDKERFDAELLFIKQFQKQEIQLPELQIEGYEWIFDKKTKKIEINIELEKSDPETMQNYINFYVNQIKIQFQDASPLIKKIQIQIPQKMQKSYEELINKAFYTTIQNEGQFKLILLFKEIASQRKNNQDFRIFDWENLAINSKLNKSSQEIWKHILVKIMNIEKNYITIGPVDRNGKKQQNSISYQYEGFIWRLFNLFAALYPRIIVPSGDDKFKINKQYPEFLHFKQTLNSLAHQQLQLNQDQQKQIQQFFENKNNHNIMPQVTSKLWDHQYQTSQKITQGFIKYGRKGFGDASCVGAGKTLSAITVMINLLNNNVQNIKNSSFKGFLVLIPFKTLFDTWTQEIKKHTKNVNIVTQNANGELTGPILYNTIVISTLARAREHPFQQSWVLVVIDECLAVQRREALQTEEAWRQVICSQYGVLMMSATFFRSRFDQLFFMLKMLRTQIQENKEFLDCLLTQSMICYISEQKRKWNIETKRIKLSENLLQGYNKIKQDQNIESDKLYMLLSNYLYKNYDILKDWKQQIKDIEQQNQNSKILIYGRSKEEANLISQNISNVSRFPDVSGKHVVASYHEATFGINTLVKYNTIMTRPPEPDKLPQMKGRLDRQGQTDDILQIVYLVLEDTIEEASLFRLELCEQFLNHYIMPLANFYDYAVGKVEFKKKN